MDNKINIVISKNRNGYSVNFPELEPINYQASSLDGVLNQIKETLSTHLNYADISTPKPGEAATETTGESILKMVDKLTKEFPEEELEPLPSNGKEIMKFAGSWEDLPEEDFRSFCEEIEQRRQNSSSRRF